MPGWLLPGLAGLSSSAGQKRGSEPARPFAILLYPLVVLYFVLAIPDRRGASKGSARLLLAVFFGLVWLGAQGGLLPRWAWSSASSWPLPLKVTQSALDALHTGYPRALRWALRNPLAILGWWSSAVLLSTGLDGEPSTPSCSARGSPG